MRLRHKALILLFLVLAWRGTLHSFGGNQYDPPPLPDPFDIPFPDDPPDLFTDPFDPINDLPDPFDIPFPPEDLPDPFDDPFPVSDLPDLPDPFDRSEERRVGKECR